MQTGMSNLIRGSVILAVVIGLPLMAFPNVTKRIGGLLYGTSADPLPRIAPVESLQDQYPSRPAGELAPINFEAPVELTAPPPLETGLDNRPASPPEFSAQPVFQRPPQPLPADDNYRPLPVPPANRPMPSPPQAEAAGWQERVSAVRLQLERWGADYLLLESVGEGNFRFHCRMAVTMDGKETKSFEAMAGDPAVAAEQVFDAVALWRANSIRR